MSNLNELLERLSGTDQVEEVTPETDVDAVYLDPIFIEKLASAVEYLADGFEPELHKEANINEVKANLAKGMSMEAAVRAAYPAWSDEQVKSFIAQQGDKLSAAPKEAPAEEPKKEVAPKALLAKKMLDNIKDKEASADNTNEVIDKLRGALKEKVAAQVQEKQEEEISFIDSIMAKIDALNVDAEKTAEKEEPEEPEETEVEKEASEESTESEEAEESTTEVSEDDEPVEKKASEDSEVETKPKLSLANMLKNANLESTEDAVESVSSGNVKTAANQGSIISSKLKSSLLSKVRTEV